MTGILKRVAQLEEAISELPDLKNRIHVLEKGVEKVVTNLMPTLEAVLSSSENVGLTANSVLSTNLQTGDANTQPSSVSSGIEGPDDTDDAAPRAAASPACDGARAGRNLDAPSPHESVLAAAEGGDGETLALLLATGADAQQRNRHGDTALHLAATHGHLVATVVLLAFGASVDAPGRRLRTPLHCAAAHGRLHVAQRLLAAGADVIAEDADGLTPVTRAAEGGHEKVLDMLMKNVAGLGFLTKRAEQLVFWAATRGYVNFVQLAVNAGLPADVRDGEGEPLALRSAKAGQWAVVTMLVREGFDGAVCMDPECYAHAGCFETVLALASAAGEGCAVREVLADSTTDILVSSFCRVEDGICSTFDISCSWEISRWSRLRQEQHVTSALRVAKNAQVLSAFGNAVKERGGAEAMFHAARDGNLARLNNLVAAGAESSHYFAGKALIAACVIGHMGCVTALLDIGVSVDFVYFPYCNPLVAASKAGWPEVVRELLRRGARDKDNRALLLASNGAVVWALAEGARDALRGKVGGEALACAVEGDRLEAMVALLDAGVDVKLAGKALSRTALHSAASKGNRCAEELLKRETFADD